MIRNWRKILTRCMLASGLIILPAHAQSMDSEEAAVEAEAPTTIISHGLSTFGELKYPKDFAHFDYVNPEAPKGGSIRHSGIIAQRTFDSLNPWILKGDAAEGTILQSQDGAASLIFDTLMIPSGDEPDALYGLVAREVEYPQDRSWVIFRLRPEARFHDGTPITAEDVKFSLEILKDKGDPRLVFPLREVDNIDVLGSHEIKVSFVEGALTRDLPATIAGYPVLSKAYYKANDFTKSTLEPPLGSGPYKVGNFKQGNFIEYDRDPDYWGKDLPVNLGRWNFDTIRYEFYQDRSITLQSLKAGQLNMNEIFSSKYWATELDFPAVQEGKAFKRLLTDSNAGGVQGWYMNTRRTKFADIRVRQALDLAFDFEWTNKTIFYGAYKRTSSFFQGSPDMGADGPPSEAELVLLEPHRDQLPPEVFDTAYVPPVTDGSGRIRENLRQARGLLQEAGWVVQDGVLKNADGEAFTIEFLETSQQFERILNPYIQNLKLLGIEANMRLVDPAQYERRTKSFDFDLVSIRYTQSNAPGVELRNYFSSEQKDSEGGWNFAGIDDPVVDALVEHIVAAKSRADLVAATRALDRVLRAGHYWVPAWNNDTYRIVHWDEFGWPEIQPIYQRGILDTWWFTRSLTKPSEPEQTGEAP